MEHLDDEHVTHPLTPQQQVFWALSEIFPDAPVCNEALCLRLRGPLDRQALLASVQELARRYDSWRTTIELDPEDPAGAPLAYVRPFEPFPIEAIDLGELRERDREAALAAQLHARVQTRLDLKAGPLVRVALFRCSDELHVLQFVSHHVAFDALSLFELLPRALAEVYSAFRRGETPEPKPGSTFAEFARNQHERCDGAAGPDVEFWREALSGASGAIELPSDRPRPARRGWRGLRERLLLPAALKERLTERARELQASLSDLLLAGYVALLHRYSALTDVLVGIPNGNRRDARYAAIFGLVMLTLPVRFDLRTGNPTVRDLLLIVRNSKRSAFEHLDPRVDEVLREQVGGRDGESPSGYQVVFNYARLALEGVGFDGLDVRAERPDPGWTAVDLSLDVTDGGDGLELTIEVSCDRFDAATARRCLGHYVRLLEAIASGAEGPISDLPLLDDDERAELVTASAAPRLDYPREQCVHTYLSERASQATGAWAALCGERGLARADLHERARRLGDHLVGLGAMPGERVALVLDDPLDGLVGMLGALESGAAFVPIDAALPQARLRHMLEAARPVAVVTRRALAGELKGTRAPQLYIDDLPTAPRRVPDGPRREVQADDPAYVVFTSGSTGLPKGVVVRHRNLVSQLAARLDGYSERPERLLTAHSFAFDAAFAGIYWALAAGATLILPEPDERRDPIALRRLIARHRVTHLDLPPALHQELLASDSEEDLSSLTAVIVGGEACTSALAGSHARHLPGARLYNEYGPTETTIYSTVHEVSRGASDPVPIGRPIANTRCYVLDSMGERVPHGVPGELFIGGDGVAAGYLDQPELTDARFIDDPFALVPGEKMYRTGDRARLRSDGLLEFLGRVDRQRKIRGNRVEPAEIEAALLRCTGVRAAVALPRDEPGEAAIDAFVVLSGRHPPTLHDVRAALQRELPAYMMPARLAPIASVPLTAAGKLDVERLRALAPFAAAAEHLERVHIEPRTQLELQLAALWGELLGHPPLGVHDDFADLGGHSLMAVRMLRRVADLVGVRVPLASFARHATIASLAALIHQEGGIPEEPLVVPIQPKGDRLPFWMLHPVGGHVVFAERLARHLDASQPLLGIQAQGLDGHREPHRSIAEMADLYVEMICQAQVEGPYFLGGYSMGGSIALEIARRLRASRRTVGLVALLDAPGPDYPRRLALPMRAVDRMRFLFKPGWRRSAFLSSMQGPETYFAYPAVDEAEDSVKRVSEALERAAAAYHPTFYDGTLHVFRALRTPSWPGCRFDDPMCGWGPFARSIEVVPIDCFLQIMMDEPAVAEVGMRLDAVLAETQRRFARS